MRRALAAALLLAGACAVSAPPAAAQEPAPTQDGAPADSLTEATGPWRWAIGASVGFPQILAVTAEKSLGHGLRVQGNLGTIVVVNAVNVRLLLLPERWVIQPYGFLGGGVAYAFAIEDLYGAYGYPWVGYGLRIAVNRVVVFGELSFLGGSDDLYDSLGYAAGVLFQFH